MNTDDIQATTWVEFLRETGLDQWPSSRTYSERDTLAPLRAEVERLGLGRPRKQPPVPVPDGSRYCWSCQTVHPRASFTIDRRAADGLKADCRRCDATARARRKRERNARLKSQSSNGGGVSAIQ